MQRCCGAEVRPRTPICPSHWLRRRATKLAGGRFAPQAVELATHDTGWLAGRATDALPTDPAESASKRRRRGARGRGCRSRLSVPFVGCRHE